MINLKWYLRVHFICITLALPWKLKVKTNSPFLVSLCLTKNTPWPAIPSCKTNWAASDLGSVPWNHGYSFNAADKSNSVSATKKNEHWLKQIMHWKWYRNNVKVTGKI